MPRNARRRGPAPPLDTQEGLDTDESAVASPGPMPSPPQPLAAGPSPHVPREAAQLRRAREARRLSLEDVVHRTKVSPSMLHAIEAMDLSRLPVATYTRGFVKSYAREVGLDPEATATAYLEAVERLKRGAQSALPTTAPQPSLRSRQDVDLNSDPRFGMTGLIVTIGCAAALALYAWSSQQEPQPQTVDRSTADAASALARAAAQTPSPRPDAVTTSPDPIVVVPPRAFRLELRAEGTCWISATVDGRPALSRLLAPGDRRTLDVMESVTLRVGEPGALRYSIDGRDGEPLGRAGQPITVRITRGNLHEFVR